MSELISRIIHKLNKDESIAKFMDATYVLHELLNSRKK